MRSLIKEVGNIHAPNISQNEFDNDRVEYGGIVK